MGGKNADLALSQGAEAVLDIVAVVETKDNGCFRNICVPGWDGSDGRNVYDGKDLLW